MNFDTNTNAPTGTEECGTAQVTADPSTLLRALSKSFTNTTIVLAELIQNCRRAGATRIDFTVSDELIMVQDDGCGIDDFNVLLAIAQSGWDEAVKRNDAPYGLGFLSSIFSCKYLGVMSKGMHLYAATDDILDIKKIPVNRIDVETRTEIRLHEHKLGNTHNVISQIKHYARGFPVPIFVNGAEVERPDAMDNLDLVETEVGLVTEGVLRGYGAHKVYLQGLPIGVSAHGTRSRDYRPDGKYDVLHLASPRFEGRMPDRAQLINSHEAQVAISQCFRGLARDYLLRRAKEVSAAEFVYKYHSLATSLGMHDLMNSFDVIPSSWVESYIDTPTLTPRDWEAEYSGPARDADGEYSRVLTREQLVANGVFQLESFDEYHGDFLAAHATYRMGAFVASGIPSWHWAHKLVKEVSPESFELIVGNEIGRHDFVIWGERLEVVLVESLKARTVEVLRTEIETVDIPLYYRPQMTGNVLYMTPTAYAQDAVRNVTDFVSDDDHDETAQDNAAGSLHAIIQSLQNADPLELFRSVMLNNVDRSSFPNSLRGKTFKVSFDENGKMTFENA